MHILKNYALIIFLALALFISPVAYGQQSSGQSLQLFSTEDAAQQHCPQDTVVWLNSNSDVYHFKGQRWYGNTKNGAYVCRKEADNSGDRATRNGQ